MDVLPEILHALKRFHQQYYDDFDDGLCSDREFFDMLRDKEDIYLDMFLDHFRGEHWFKYKEIEDVDGYDVSTLIHMIQHLKNTKKVIPNMIDCFNEYRYTMIETLLLHHLDTVIEAYLDFQFE